VSQTTHHGWTQLPLCPLAASLPLAAPSARFVYLLVCLLVGCCIVTQNAGTTPSNLPPPPPRVDYLIIVKLYINTKSYDYLISYPPPTSLIVENEQLFKVTRHIMVQYEQVETNDGEWKDASRGSW
jgi:hypothetical protein